MSEIKDSDASAQPVLSSVKSESGSIGQEWNAWDNENRNAWGRFVNSFKRAEKHSTPSNGDLEHATTHSVASSSPLKRSIKPRHVAMMSICTGIGTGLLVANGKSLRFGGPAGLIIGYAAVSVVAYIMMQAAGEMAVAYPSLPGNFNAYSSQLISRPFGFATVWLYCIQWLTVLPLELITASLTIKYWNDSINADAVSYTHLDVYKRQLRY